MEIEEFLYFKGLTYWKSQLVFLRRVLLQKLENLNPLTVFKAYSE